MTRSIIATVGALGFAVTAFAQSPQTPPQTPRPEAPPSASASASMDTKITGCLKAGADANSFELTRSKKDKGASASASASASTDVARADMAKTDKATKLVAAAGVDLASHIGHTVELSGSWSGTAAADPAAPASAAAAKTFTVSNVKMVSATCTTGTN
jgi:hypothetical protein